MKLLADRRVAVLDANVLFPFRKRDILFRFHQAGLFRARWTERILDDWTRNLLELKRHLERSVRSQRRAMHEHLSEALVAGYESLIGTLDLPDADGFLSRTFDLYPSEVLAELRALRETYRNPSFTPSGFVRDLAAKRLPRLAAIADQHREVL